MQHGCREKKILVWRAAWRWNVWTLTVFNNG